MCTRCSIGSNSFSSFNFTPRAAKLAQPVNCFVRCVVDSFMMILLSQSSDSTRGMAHHSSFGKVLSCGSLPLIWAKFRYLQRHTQITATEDGITVRGLHSKTHHIFWKDARLFAIADSV